MTCNSACPIVVLLYRSKCTFVLLRALQQLIVKRLPGVCNFFSLKSVMLPCDNKVSHLFVTSYFPNAWASKCCHLRHLYLCCSWEASSQSRSCTFVLKAEKGSGESGGSVPPKPCLIRDISVYASPLQTTR